MILSSNNPVVNFTEYDKTAVLLNVAFYRHNTTTNTINDINNKIQLLIMLMILIIKIQLLIC